jgi:hypothetical protein
MAHSPTIAAHKHAVSTDFWCLRFGGYRADGMRPDEIALLLTLALTVGFLVAVTVLAFWLRR